METRRQFLKQLGITAVAASLSAGLISAAEGLGSKKGSQLKLKNNKVAVSGTWDVIVVGGGPSGCTAAIAAAREGARTLLIEATGQLGGMGTIGMVPAWCPFSDGEKMIYRGLAEQVFNRAKKGVPHEPKDKLDWVNINAEYLMRVYDNMVAEAGAKVLFFSRLAAVEKSGNGTIDSIIVANKEGLTAFKAKMFIDATGDGDLAAWAGAEFLKGDRNGVLQDSTLCFAIANVDIDEWHRGPNLHSDNKNSPLHKTIDSGRYPLLAHHFCLNQIGPGVLQFNAGHITVDTTNPWAVSDAMVLGRRIAQQYLEALKETCPGTFANSFVVKTAPALGTRDSRRIIGDYVLTGDDWRARRTFDDEIGRNCYYLDIHKKDFVPVYYQKGDSHGIPYRCLTPKGFSNLLTAGRCVSTDDEVFGSLRVMPPCLVTGEAAGMAAAHAIEQHVDVHNVDIDRLRRRLKEEGQYFL